MTEMKVRFQIISQRHAFHLEFTICICVDDLHYKNGSNVKNAWDAIVNGLIGKQWEQKRISI